MLTYQKGKNNEQNNGREEIKSNGTRACQGN